MSNTFDKLSVLDSFIEEVNSYLPAIETNLERLAQSPGDMDALEETHRHAHTIGGAASMMDFPGLAHVAYGMEDILTDASEGLTSLDEPTLGLLQRSLGRLHQLLEGVRNGIDEESVIAEDDADYARYRELVETSSQAVQPAGASDAIYDSPVQEVVPSASSPQSFDMPTSSMPSIPSFDEVLASFRTPSVMPGEDVGWPEEPVSNTYFEEAPVVPQQSAQFQVPPPPLQQSSSAWDALVASTRQQSPSTPPVVPATPSLPVEDDLLAPPPTMHLPGSESTPYVQESPWESSASYVQEPTPWENNVPYVQESTPWENNMPYVQETPWEERPEPATALPQVYEDAQRDTRALEVQVSSLKNVVSQLRSAISVIESQRTEFKGFLNGSKDALDRMEDWAGQAMGLNLRNSPEQVRRYLPLSVMWVSNSKLKKVLDLLHQITSGVELTDEQFNSAIQQLHTSLEACGEAFRQMQAESAPGQEAGWSPWEMQTSRDTQTLRERVTFERQGDMATLRAEVEASLRAELEASLREELRREYASPAISLAMRAELEQQIRNELRQEFAERQRLQERVSGTGDDSEDALQELEARMRSEIEIQVRQEFLNSITTASADAARAPQMPDQLAANFINRSREAAGPTLMAPMTPAPAPMAPWQASKPGAPSLPPASQSTSSASAYSADLSEEAAEIFRLEAEEHLQTISTHVASLEKNPTNLDLIQGVRRATHTLKGAAAMMGFRAIADLCHISEDLLDKIMEGSTTISSSILSIILDTAEALDMLITGRGSINPTVDEAKIQALHTRYAELLGEKGPTPRSVVEDIEEDTDVTDPGATVVSGVLSTGQPTENAPQRANRGELSVHVRLQKLDELVNLFGELLVNRSVLEERIQRLVRLVSDVGVSSNRLRDVGQKLDSRFEAATLPSGHSVQVMPGEGNQSLILSKNNARNGKGSGEHSPDHFSEFDELELDRYTEFHQLARGLSEGISDMATLSTEMDAIIRECEGVFARENRLSTTFQDRLMKVRLVPLSNMAPRLYRAALSVALKQGKEIDFLLEGETTEVDRVVYEEIAGPLLHLVRNAVNHAIETPDVRAQKGKPSKGQIKLSAGYEGNQIVITVRDDGLGIDPERVRATAVSRGLLRPDQHLSDSDLLALIFQPGFSTAQVVSEESGRGVGLDVVRDSVSRLRGTIVVDSMPGQGAAFTMTFPTSLAIQRAMMVRIGGQQFAIPTVNVEAIGRLDNFKQAKVSGQPAVVVQNEIYPLHMLGQYLSLPVGVLDEKAQLLFVTAGGNRIALAVDEIKGQFDIVMKNLGPHLRQVHGIAGGTVLGNGRVVLILELNGLLSTPTRAVNLAAAIPVRREAGPQANPATVRQRIDLAPGYASNAAMRPTNVPPPAPERGKHILVVDDSPSVRRVVSNMLKGHSWEVQMARDGQEALEMISYETPAAVLLDIEMPRMDGYELISTVRAQEQYRTLPLIVLTSRASTKHQQRAMMLGASAYVVKPYQDEELLNIINSLVYGAVTH